MTLTRLALLPFIAGWLVRWMKGQAEIKLTPPVVAWFLVVAALIVSFPAASDRVAWSEEVYRWAIAFALYVVACDSMISAQSCRPVIVGASIGVALCVGVATWQIITMAGPASFQANGLTRVYAFFGEPNPLAGYLEMTLPLLVALLLPWILSGGRTDSLFGAKGMVVLTMLVAAGIATLLLTQSRGGYLGISASLLLVGLLSGRRAKKPDAGGNHGRFGDDCRDAAGADGCREVCIKPDGDRRRGASDGRQLVRSRARRALEGWTTYAARSTMDRSGSGEF